MADLLPTKDRETIAREMAMVIRDLMRAVSTENDDGYKAAKQMEQMLSSLVRSEEQLSLWNVLSDALKIMRSNLPQGQHEHRYLRAARNGIKYFTESSADDRGANGRTVERLRDFEDSIRLLQEPQNLSPELERTERLLAENAQRIAGKSK